ncbi:hypothetical protein M441DRAFT_296435 [Trichoderma asperellum CBS 433.97]|uniref:Uncharacterized protein n=1 Tax=Trichoderma asperellum (strain ATCC 204424 / CBS 433.97 / NBRC 101777) TaxID=1042311 RepID=A0A2T3YSX4_TRIA4|nr:hypothetical protein M441DRAFT_296435 [Trichoderma asperellum CBS 433.97]PTB35604.1 hypothetical protein M441DRAFT_296435 [Trichoderma asperellum CBS 433.97]
MESRTSKLEVCDLIWQGGQAKMQSLAWAVVASLVSGWTGFRVREPGDDGKQTMETSPFVVFLSLFLSLSLCAACLPRSQSGVFLPGRKLSCGGLRRGGRLGAMLEWALQGEAIKKGRLLARGALESENKKKGKERDGREMMSTKLVEPMEMRRGARFV